MLLLLYLTILLVKLITNLYIYLEGMFIMNKKIGLTILCLLIILTGCSTPKDEKVQANLLKPKVVISEFFLYYNQQNLQGMNSLSTERHHFSKSFWEFDNLNYIKAVHIVEYINIADKEIYLRNNIHGKEKNHIIDVDKEKSELENIIIFKVDFVVKYKQEGIGPSDSGPDTYYYTLIRKDKNSSWLIDSAGH